MSKVAKKVGRSLKKFVSGVNKLQKKIRNSKVFKVIAIAAAVYFTGGAILGAMGGASAASAAGTSVLAGAAKGAVAGIGSAGAGITNAWGSLMGGNIAGVGSSLSGGITGASAAGGSAVAGGFSSAMSTGFNATKGLLNPTVATGPTAGSFTPAGGSSSAFNPGANAVSGVMPSAGNVSVTSANVGSMSVEQLMAQPVEALRAASSGMSAGQVSELTKAGIDLAAKPGLLKSMFSSPYAVPMAMQIGGNALASKGETEYIDEKESDDRARYKQNIGGRINPDVYKSMG
jgi:hypothetical protein